MRSEGRGAREARDRIRDMFDRIVARYDLLNRLLSFGLDLRWRRSAVSCLDVGSKGKELDLCTGSGDLVLMALRCWKTSPAVVGLDISRAMLAVARAKAERLGRPGRVRWIRADAEQLPFSDATFDGVMVAFGVRNLPDLDRGLGEIVRVLKPGGRLILVAVGAPRFWRASWAKALLRMALAVIAHIYLNARIQSEVEALSNVRTAFEWRAALSEAGFERIDIAKSPARRRWYPCALTVKAAVGDT